MTMTYTEAEEELKRVGASHASGEALAASFADIVSGAHGGKPEKYYNYLRTATSDKAMLERLRPILNNRNLAWDILMGLNQ